MEFFRDKDLPLYDHLRQADKNYTPLNLASMDIPSDVHSQAELEREWAEKSLHGRFRASLNRLEVDLPSSTLHLTKQGLTPEAEGAITAIQDQVVATRSYVRHILKQNIPSDSCRLCGDKTESIQHISGGCSIIAPKEYTNRHNDIAKIIHSHLCLKHNILKNSIPYYKYQPENIGESDSVKIYWDTMLITDRRVLHNKPDIVVIDKREREGFILDVAVPLDDNIHKTYIEKVTKYQDLTYELKHLYRLKKVEVLPFVISTNGLVEKRFTQNLAKVGLSKDLVVTSQRAAILGTCHIVRRYMLKGS